MPKVSNSFGPIYQTAVLDGSGNGTVSFQAVGDNIRLTNIFFKVATSTAQATCNIYKGQVADGNIVFHSNSGSTGGNAKGNVDLFDGDTCYVRWTGGDVGAIATATFVGHIIPFGERVLSSELVADDPIAAGDGSLIFPSIKSPNYVAGVSGWYIGRDGTVEFGNGVFRGELRVNGNNGSYIRIFTTGSGTPVIHLRPEPPASGTAIGNPGVLLANDTAFGAGFAVFTELTSPSLTGRAFAVMDMVSQNDGGDWDPTITWDSSDNASHPLRAFVTGSLNVSVLFSFGSLFNLTDNVDPGRGWVNGAGITTSSAAVGNTETTVLTLPSFTYKANRAYRMSACGMVSVSVAPNYPVLRFRKTNPAGQQLDVWRVNCATTATFNSHFEGFFQVGGSDVTATLVITIIGSAAFNAQLSAAATSPYSFNVSDAGDAADFSWAATLV